MLPLEKQVVFHRDERWIEKDQAMGVTVEVAGRRVTCLVSEDVLKTHFGSLRIGRFQAFRENRQQIEEVIARKIQPGETALQLGLTDFEDSADFIPWER
ncbi:DUF1488 family protein [Caulifigura coniformis]|nr:DUF1488 family protein [Caulifigura coniformis]